MAPINRTANSHQTSFLVREHVPEFVRSDHPQFINFVEKYYEFMANNTLMKTSSNTEVYYYGADFASKVLQDIKDVDKTDFVQFIQSFRAQYGYGLPVKLYEDPSPNNRDTNLATLYKNLVDFYQAVGTEDSFKTLFRLIYNEDIEIYYPAKDMLIASGGDYVKEARVKVNYVDGLNLAANKMLVGSNSGAYGTIERVQVLPKGSDNYISGKVPNSPTYYQSGIANNEIHDPAKFSEHGTEVAFVYLTDFSGTFDLYEDVYYSDGGVANTTIASNTIILPLMKRLIYFDSFAAKTDANSVVSLFDGRMEHRANSTNPPWGSSNISFGNTGQWHTTGHGQGEIKIVSNNVPGVIGGRVLEVGNNHLTGNAFGDLRHFVYSRPIGIRGDDHIYRLSIRARDLGGNSAHAVSGGNRFSCGVVPLRHDRRIISADDYIKSPNANTDNYDNPFWFVSHQQAIDDEFYIYTSYFKGRETEISTSAPYLESNYGNGGRLDLNADGTSRYYNSLHKALDNNVRLPFNTTYIMPTFKVNEPGGTATYSQGITQVDFISLEEITSMQTQQGARTGRYRSDSSLLSSSSRLYDGYYRQQFAYDIRSRQQMGGSSGYASVVRDTVHPAGLKMFGTTIIGRIDSEPVGATLINIDKITSQQAADGTITNTFLPSQLNSLAGWWRADAIGPKNIQYRNYDPSGTSNGVYGTEKNRFPVGWSSFEDLNSDYTIRTGSTVDEVVASGSNDVYVGNRSLKITDQHTSTTPNFDFPTRGTSTPFFFGNEMKDLDDADFPIIIEPYRKWVFSVYAKVSNTSVDSGKNAFALYSAFANTSGSDFSGLGLTSGQGIGNSYPLVGISHFSEFSAADTWERKSTVLDFSSSPHTRIGFRIQIGNRSAFNESTGNTTYHFDGFMLEEYDPAVHGTDNDFLTPSPFIETGMSGSNVISWFDQSPNKHHVYANTYGGKYYAPQFVANAVNGKPAIRFSANTVKNTGNVYPYSSIGGTVNSFALELGDTTNFKPPTTALKSLVVSNSSFGYTGGTLASPSLPRPVANTWTIMAVVRSNYGINATSYDTSLNPTIFNSGYAGNKDATDSLQTSMVGTMHLGYQVVGDTGSVVVNVVNSSARMTNANTLEVSDFGGLHSSPNTSTSFAIVGVSVNAVSRNPGTAPQDLLAFHVNGRRFANSLIGNHPDDADLSMMGLDWKSQNAYVTSIGAWVPGNNYVHGDSAEVANIYPSGTAHWDGDIAEIVVFNDMLSNTNISLVEGYLAHKYGLQDNLIYKDGASSEEEYRWEFANTTDGWHFTSNTGSPTLGWVWSAADANSYIDVTAPGNPCSLRMDINTIAISGTRFNQFEIRFNTIDAPTQGVGTLIYETANGTSVARFDQNLGLKSTGWKHHYIDLSGDGSWVGQKITKMQYLFDFDTDGSQSYYVDYVRLSGNSFSHPYKEVPPAIDGHSNTWFTKY